MNKEGQRKLGIIKYDYFTSLLILFIASLKKIYLRLDIIVLLVFLIVLKVTKTSKFRFLYIDIAVLLHPDYKNTKKRK